MLSTTTYSRGDIILVPFMFSDSDRFKPRPALVLSPARFQDDRADIVVAALTTRLRVPLLFGDYLIDDWHACGLPKRSVVTGILRTVKHFLVVRRLGSLPPVELSRYSEVLRASLDL